MSYLVAVLLGYCLGSVSVSSLVARRAGVDLRASGDGNPGAWNALEQLGRRRALPAFFGDGGKAALAALLTLPFGGWWVQFAAVAGAMLGHAFPLPVPRPRRGGKSVMCFVGGVFVLSPLPALICLLVAAATRAAVGARAGALAGVWAVPVLQALHGSIDHVKGTGALMTLIGVLFLVRRSPGPASAASGAATRG